MIASHSSVRGVYNHPRNLSDEALTALRDNGGVAQMVAFDYYLRPVAGERQAALRALRTEMGIKGFADFEQLSDEQRNSYDARRGEIDFKWPKASVKDFADHIDYAVNLVGIDHVGMASDFNGGGGIAGGTTPATPSTSPWSWCAGATRKAGLPNCGAATCCG